MFISSVENAVEFYQYVLLQLLKGTSYPYNLRVPFYVITVPTPLDPHNSIYRHSASYTPKSCICFTSVSLLTLHIHLPLLSSLHSQLFSSHICVMCSICTYTLPVCFPIPTSTCFSLSVTPHIKHLYMCGIKIKTQHTFRNVFPVVTATVSTQFERISE
jgi:hypothetical protein